MRLSLIAMVLVLGACKGGQESGESDPDHTDPLWCGDVDGAGGETGDVPNVLGDWTARAATNYFEEECGISDLDEYSIGFVQGTMAIEGNAPDGLRVIFNDDRKLRLKGIMAPTGGINISGRRDTSWGVMYVALGGLVFEDIYLKKSNIQGFLYAGIDQNDDEVVDCHLWSDWRATKAD